MGAGREHEDNNHSSHWLYDMFIFFFSIVFDLFFRQIQPRGSYKIPRTGPVIFVGAPHSNQFVDPFMILINCFFIARRRVSFLIAAVSYKRPLVGRLARAMQAIPVGRSQDTLRKATGRIHRTAEEPLVIYGEGTKFTKEAKVGGYLNVPGSSDLVEVTEIKSDTELTIEKDFRSQKPKSALAKGSTAFRVADHVDNSQMFKSVFEHLAGGGCLGIFPEGGSHDRTEMLPLKPGVAIMALGTLAKYPDCDLSIVPVGLNYFHPNKFRSRAVIEFGDSLKVDPDLVEQYKQGGDVAKKAVGEFLSQIADKLESVTINCPDYETLMIVQACQRLYRPSRNIPLPLVIEFTRRFVRGYNIFKDDPRVITLRKDITDYNNRLQNAGLSDHQVPTVRISKFTVLVRLVYRTVSAVIIAILCVPGVTLFSPVFVATKVISRRKAAAALRSSNVKVQGKDVIATWKLFVALWLTPSLFTFYSIVICYFSFYYKQWWAPDTWRLVLGFCLSYAFLIVVTYSTLKMGEVGLDLFRVLYPQALALSPTHNDALQQLRAKREQLVFTITDLVNELGPEIFPDIADRIEKQQVVYTNPSDDPRTDLQGLTASLSKPGDYNLSDVPIFSMTHPSEGPSRLSRSNTSDHLSEGVNGESTSVSLNDEITQRIKRAMESDTE